MEKICWCGNSYLAPWHDSYLVCAECQTLINTAESPSSENVADDGTSIYDSSYWIEGMLAAYKSEYGCEDIDDVIFLHYRERAAYWVQTFLRHMLPPAKVLEIGCGMGTFTHWLYQLGFEAVATELSPGWRRIISDKLGIAVSDYKLSAAGDRTASFDAIVAFDVLEHIEAPLPFFEALRNELKQDGIIMLQLPCYPENSTYAKLDKEFTRHLHTDHMIIYSKKSIKMLLEKFGFAHVKFYDNINGGDMFLIASHCPLEKYGPKEMQTSFARPATIAPYAALLNCQHANGISFLDIIKRRIPPKAKRILRNIVRNKLLFPKKLTETRKYSLL